MSSWCPVSDAEREDLNQEMSAARLGFNSSYLVSIERRLETGVRRAFSYHMPECPMHEL
jgi:hypothetical protein